LSTLRLALQQLTKQNEFLLNKFIVAEKKTIKINFALNTLSKKINSIPVSEKTMKNSMTSSPLFKFNSNNVSNDVIELCQKQIVKFYGEKSNREEELMNQKLNEEPIDTQWSDYVDSILASMLEKNNLTGSDVTYVSCHTTICEINIKHDDRTSKINFSRSLPKGLDFKYSNNNDLDDLTEVLFLMGSNTEISYNNY